MRDRTIVDELIQRPGGLGIYKSFSFINSTILLLANNIFGQGGLRDGIWFDYVIGMKLFVLIRLTDGLVLRWI